MITMDVVSDPPEINLRGDLMRVNARVNRVSRAGEIVVWCEFQKSAASVPRAGAVRFRIDRDGDLIGGEVKLAAFAEDPAAFDS